MLEKLEEMLDKCKEPYYGVEYWDSGNFDDAFECGVDLGRAEMKIEMLHLFIKMVKDSQSK